jgi:hypothetical protein
VDLQEEMPPFGPRSSAAEIFDQSVAHLGHHRKLQLPTGFGLPNKKGAPSPIEIIESQTDDFTCSQTIGRDEEQHRVIAPPQRRSPVHLSNCPLDVRCADG